MTDPVALGGMALAAFLAATPVPFNSELPFLALLAAGWAPLVLVPVAAAANVLGSCVTYGLGRALGNLRDHPRFPLRPATLARAEGWYARWGLWSLLLSWAPGGDVLVALAGVLRTPVLAVVALLTLAKTARYALLAWAGMAALRATLG